MKIEATDFNLEATLESGQVFGFERVQKNQYRGCIYGRNVILSQDGIYLDVVTDSLRLRPLDVIRYFDLHRDLNPVYASLKAESALMPAYEEFRGLRLIRQQPWEALACFLISQNNNIKRIQSIWKKLSGYFPAHEKIFPSALQIGSLSERILRELGLGYRAKYLLRTARDIAKKPRLIRKIELAHYDRAKMELMKLPGVGEKVADCVLLYGFQKFEAFPVDVWVKRVMESLYFKNKETSERKIMLLAGHKWGSFAGYVQQYLFHAARLGAISISMRHLEPKRVQSSAFSVQS